GKASPEDEPGVRTPAAERTQPPGRRRWAHADHAGARGLRVSSPTRRRAREGARGDSMYRTKLTAIGGIALSLVIACSDDETDPTATTATTTGAGAGGAGAGGAGAGGALEGGGGASGACLPSSSHADVFTLPADL